MCKIEIEIEIPHVSQVYSYYPPARDGCRDTCRTTRATTMTKSIEIWEWIKSVNKILKTFGHR